MKEIKWNLGLLYKNDKDPRIEADIAAMESAAEQFSKKYSGKDYFSTPEKLLAALNDFEKVYKIFNWKPWWYFTLRHDINTDDSKAAAMATRAEQRIRAADNKTTFFTLEIAKIPKNEQEAILLNPKLSRFTYFLKLIFDRAKYNLTEQEEQLQALLSQTSYQMWIDHTKQLVNQQTVTHKGKKIPLSEAVAILADLPKNDRRQLSQKINQVNKSISFTAEAELNAILNYKKINDERRGYAKPYSSILLGNENDEKEIEDLIKVVTDNFAISKRFYKLHAKLLGEKKLLYADRGAKIGKINKKYTFEDAVKLVDASFKKVDKKYSDILQKFVKNGQIDVYPRKGKTSGGYCWGVSDLPVYILLNHVGTIDSVETLAHEMGHAIHNESDDHLPMHYQGHSTATAEVASMFFEQLMSEELMETLTDREKIIMLHGRINREIYAIFGQIIGFNYELDMHELVRKEGKITKERMAQLMKKHLESYLGNAFSITEDDGYRYVGWVHIRLMFYMYTYAYGQIISRVLLEKWKEDHSFAKNIEQFLTSGRTMSPRDIFKSIGIETNAAFFERGLKAIESDIDKLEKLVKKQKKI